MATQDPPPIPFFPSNLKPQTLSTHDSQASRPKPHKLKVIGASLPRTGSLAMYTALNTLGIKSYHMHEVLMNPDRIPIWDKAYTNGELSDDEWDQVLDGYEAVNDIPCCQFVKELAVMNPDAKVIITTRDGKAWEKSLRDTMCWPLPGLDSWIVWATDPAYRSFRALCDKIFWGKKGLFPGKSEPDGDALARYVADIQQFFAERGESHRVLLYETRADQDGYDIICPFLGIQKPDTPWPNLNSRSGSENKKATVSFDQITQNKLKDQRAYVARVRKNLNGLALALLAGGATLVAFVWRK